MSVPDSIAGAVVSSTVTSNVVVPVLPSASVAAQVTVVSPSGKVSPEPLLQVTGTEPSTSSDAVGFVKVTDAPAGPVASRVMSSTDVTTGATVSARDGISTSSSADPSAASCTLTYRATTGSNRPARVSVQSNVAFALNGWESNCCVYSVASFAPLPFAYASSSVAVKIQNRPGSRSLKLPSRSRPMRTRSMRICLPRSIFTQLFGEALIQLEPLP